MSEKEKQATRIDNSVYDVIDTGNPNPSRTYGDIDYSGFKIMTGRKKLEIPVSKEMLNEHIIERYLPKVFNDLSSNIYDYKHLFNVYAGKSNIQKKERKANPDKENSIVDERHTFFMVEFKKGYLYGNDTKYSCAESGSCTDELTFLSKYMTEQKKPRKNIDISEDVYIAGAGNRMILPRKNYAGMDVTKKAPFEIFNLEYTRSFIVYSSNYTHEMLFGGIITEIPSDVPEIPKYEIMIYDHKYSYRFSCNTLFPSINGVNFLSKQRHYIGYVPFSEWKINSARIGIVEVVESILDAANMISSNEVDNVIDYVNSILLVYNQKISKQSMDGVLENRAMQLNTTDPSRPADAKYLVNALNHGDVMQKYEALIKVAYSIVGVPQPTTQSTSGGDTGEARNLGGGWASASVVADNEEIMLKESEKNMLEICLAICIKHPSCPIKTLDITDIEINFNRNRNDNLLVKTQSLQNLYSMNVPKEISLNYVGISANSHEDAQAWDKADKEAKNNVVVTQKEETTEVEDEIEVTKE